MRLVLISDTHCRLKKVKIPDGDLLIHAGDLTGRGTLTEILQEAKILEKISTKFTHGCLFVPGNHDWDFYLQPGIMKDLMSPVKTLIDEEITIDGIKFYGSPWQPEFNNWAFNLPRFSQALQEVWEKIPLDTDVLITHGPQKDILDKCPDGRRVGCELLTEKIKQLKKLKLHLFGHIHHSYGTQVQNGYTSINASMCTELYKPTNSPIILDI